jgi:hypothetical protein
VDGHNDVLKVDEFRKKDLALFFATTYVYTNIIFFCDCNAVCVPSILGNNKSCSVAWKLKKSFRGRNGCIRKALVYWSVLQNFIMYVVVGTTKLCSFSRK